MNGEGNTPLTDDGRLTDEAIRAVDARLSAGGIRSMDDAAQADPAAVSVEYLLRTLDAALPPASVPPGLLDATLARIAAERKSGLSTDHAHVERPLEDAPAMAELTNRFRLARFGALGRFALTGGLAAAVILSVGVALRVTARARQSAQMMACAANLSALGTAVATYAADYSGHLPQVAGMDSPWLPSAGTAGVSNFDNLTPLLARGVTRRELVCPGEGTAILADYERPITPLGDANRGYSYINLAGPIERTWDGSSTTVVLADRNPLFAQRAGATDDSNSFNHGQTGNNMLSADGAVRWETTPDVGPGGDNIWTLIDHPAHARYNGTESATSASDIFLSP